MIRTFLTLCLFAYCIFAAYAQNGAARGADNSASPIETLKLTIADTDVNIKYLPISDKNSLRLVPDRLKDNSYPLVILHEDKFLAMSDLLLTEDNLIKELTIIKKELNAHDSLLDIREQELAKIITLQEERANMFKETATILKVQTDALTAQLTETRNLANELRRANKRDKWLFGILGAAIGATVGTVIGVVAAGNN